MNNEFVGFAVSWNGSSFTFYIDGNAVFEYDSELAKQNKTYIGTFQREAIIKNRDEQNKKKNKKTRNISSRVCSDKEHKSKSKQS